MLAQVKLPEQRTYRRQESITFRKTTEQFGGLSNISQLLLATGDLPIVEDSWKDDFWGAKPQAEEILIGHLD
jgi:predicted NAD-dependent protein-ADP-ribosyltransferase YbiA (DUF1768 family)